METTPGLQRYLGFAGIGSVPAPQRRWWQGRRRQAWHWPGWQIPRRIARPPVDHPNSRLRRRCSAIGSPPRRPGASSRSILVPMMSPVLQAYPHRDRALGELVMRQDGHQSCLDTSHVPHQRVGKDGPATGNPGVPTPATTPPQFHPPVTELTERKVEMGYTTKKLFTRRHSQSTRGH